LSARTRQRRRRFLRGKDMFVAFICIYCLLVVLLLLEMGFFPGWFWRF